MSWISCIYNEMLRLHGPQGWWPLTGLSKRNPSQYGGKTGYHPGDFSYPKTDLQRFEICVGAILTQNTAWANVEKALVNLEAGEILSTDRMIGCDEDVIRDAIRPAGYFNQKAKKLRIYAGYFTRKQGVPTRDELLSLWGIGKETADSILLYAYRQPIFVVAAYTRKIFSNLSLIDKDAEYDTIRNLFETDLPKDFKIYQEYHALIVEHAKRFYSRGMDLARCPLKQLSLRRLKR